MNEHTHTFEPQLSSEDYTNPEYVCTCGAVKQHITPHEALLTLEGMSDEEFNAFLATTPARTQMLIRAQLSDWREVLPQYLIDKDLTI